MEALAIAVTGVFLGFLLTMWRIEHASKTGLKRHWSVLEAEIEVAYSRAGDYLNGKVQAPLYRLPTFASTTAFPALLQNSDMTSDEFRVLEKFLSWVADINRGLSNADELRKAHSTKLLEQENTRLLDKCKKLRDEYYEPARLIVSRHR